MIQFFQKSNNSKNTFFSANILCWKCITLHVMLQFEMKTTASAKANTKFSGGKIACLDPILLPFFTRKTITIFYTDHLTRNICGLSFHISLKYAK